MSGVAGQRGAAVAVLFTTTIFTSALLLFFVQPLYTRMILPQIGGAAAVWTTAMLFFQTVLIGGYLYAHLVTRYLSVGVQIALHLGLLALALTALPLAVPESWSYDATRPVVTQTLWLYALGVGLPFAVLSANAPLIQSWYRQSGGPSAEDPYFLYAASNLGSLIALLAFPLVAEPLFGISTISVGWSVGFVVLGPMLLLAGLAARRADQGPARPAATASQSPVTEAPLRPATLAYWAFLAFLPSSLMLAVTSKISTDLGSFPLVWVIPLALYLLTFVLVFSTRSPLTAPRLQLVAPLAMAVLIFFSLKPAGTLVGFGLLLLAFLVVSLLAHRQLFDARPDARHLTVYYLTMSVGGAFGGIFNSIIAPLAFDRLIELTVTVALTAFLLLHRKSQNLPREVALGFFLAILAAVPMVLPLAGLVANSGTVKVALTVGVLLAAMMFLMRVRLASVTAVVVVLALWLGVERSSMLFQDRSFFGLHQVYDKDGLRTYWNGTTVHGAQFLDEGEARPTPLLYYHPEGPMAQVVNGPLGQQAGTVGVIGLGIGALSCYARPGQDWHFYEIDQKVVDIALDPALFSFMPECGRQAQIHLGDARIVLQGQADLTYDVLVIDAYSSDAIPVHLATVEAVQLYTERLAADGVLVFHISNRFYDLAQPLAAIAQTLGLEGRMQERSSATIRATVGDADSSVVVLARDAAALGEIASDPRWVALPSPRIPAWTDDHADLLAALR